MSLGISFGSIGDLIAVGQIAWSLAKALSDSRGSAKEYLGLVKELEKFNNSLLQVVALWQNYDTSPELEELGKVTKGAVIEWRKTLVDFQFKFEKRYGASFQVGGSGKWVKDASKKFLWLKEKDDVLELRRQIQSASDIITLLVLAAMGKSNKLDHTTQTLRIQAVHCLLKESVKLAEEQISHLKALEEKIDAQTQSTELILSKVTSGISTLTQVKSIVIDIRAFLEIFKTQMFVTTVTTQGLDTHWKQEPVTLEDALGNIIPIPLELVNSWDMFETLLIKRFEKLRGHIKVLRKEYAIEDSRSGRELNRRNEWSMLFRPGQKVDMSIIFKQGNAGTSCPGCQTEYKSTCESVTECKNCGIFFRRIEDTSDPIQHPTQIVPFESELPSQSQLRSAMFQTITPGAIEDSVSDFKRVRLHYQSNRLDQTLKKLEPIKFKDAIGRKFSFPFHLCHHWLGMEELILQLFQHSSILGPPVREKQYDLVSINGEIILPQYWETRIRPGMSITMHMWPLQVGDLSRRSRNPQRQPGNSLPDPDKMDFHMISPKGH